MMLKIPLGKILIPFSLCDSDRTVKIITCYWKYLPCLKLVLAANLITLTYYLRASLKTHLFLRGEAKFELMLGDTPIYTIN